MDTRKDLNIEHIYKNITNKEECFLVTKDQFKILEEVFTKETRYLLDDAVKNRIVVVLPYIHENLCCDRLKELCKNHVNKYDYTDSIKPITYKLVDRFLCYKDLYKKLTYSVTYKKTDVIQVIIDGRLTLEFFVKDLDEYIVVNDNEVYIIDWLHVDKQINEILDVLGLEE